MALVRSLLRPARRLGNTLTWPRLALVAVAVLVAAAAWPHHRAIQSLSREVSAWRPAPVTVPPAPPPPLSLPRASALPAIAAEILAAGKKAGLIRLQLKTGQVQPCSAVQGPGPGFARATITLTIQGTYAQLYALARVLEARKDGCLVSAAVKRDPPGIQARLAFEVVMRHTAPAGKTASGNAVEEEAGS